MSKCEEMVAQGLRPWQIARELKLEKAVVIKVKEKWDLKNKVFNTLKDVQQEDLAKYGLQIKIPDCKVKRAILKDVNPQVRERQTNRHRQTDRQTADRQIEASNPDVNPQGDVCCVCMHA